MTWVFEFTGREDNMKVKAYALHFLEARTWRGYKLNSLSARIYWGQQSIRSSEGGESPMSIWQGPFFQGT